MRIGPNAVLTTDYKHLQRMESTKSPYTKGPWYGTFRFQKGIDHSFSQLDEAKHNALRAKAGPGYSGGILVVCPRTRMSCRRCDVTASHRTQC